LDEIILTIGLPALCIPSNTIFLVCIKILLVDVETVLMRRRMLEESCMATVKEVLPPQQDMQLVKKMEGREKEFSGVRWVKTLITHWHSWEEYVVVVARESTTLYGC
jgi:hypothetical protein